MKRNTTPTLLIKIHMPFDEVQSVEFVFKYDQSDYAPELLRVSFDEKDKIPAEIIDSESFKVKLSLDAKDTMKLTAGVVYMDTRIVLSGGLIPPTKIVEINVKETLFGEVYGSD